MWQVGILQLYVAGEHTHAICGRWAYSKYTVIIIKTSSTDPSGKNKVVYKLLSQPHKHLRHRKREHNSGKQQTVDGTIELIKHSSVKHSVGKVIARTGHSVGKVNARTAQCWRSQSPINARTAECSRSQSPRNARTAQCSRYQSPLKAQTAECSRYQSPRKARTAECSRYQSPLKARTAECSRYLSHLKARTALCDLGHVVLSQKSVDRRSNPESRGFCCWVHLTCSQAAYWVICACSHAAHWVICACSHASHWVICACSHASHWAIDRLVTVTVSHFDLLLWRRSL